MPAPDSPTVSGVLLALLFTVRVPVLVAAVGVNLTVTVQVPLTAIVVQLLVWLKAPVTATLETVAAAVPVLVTVTVWVAAEEPTSGAGEGEASRGGAQHRARCRAGAGQAHRAGDPAGVDGDAAGAAPAAVGEYVTLTVQELFAAIDEPQLLVSANGPLAVMDDTEAAALVGLATVTRLRGAGAADHGRTERQRRRARVDAGDRVRRVDRGRRVADAAAGRVDAGSCRRRR